MCSLILLLPSIRLDCAWAVPLPPWTAWPRQTEGKAFYWYPGENYRIQKPGWPEPAAPAPTKEVPFPCWHADIPADHVGLFHRAAAQPYFTLMDLYEACEGDLPSWTAQFQCCGDGITQLGMNAMLHADGVSSVAFEFPVKKIANKDVSVAHPVCTVLIPDSCAEKPIPGCP